MLSNNNFTAQDIMQHQLYLTTSLCRNVADMSYHHQKHQYYEKSQPKHTMILSWIETNKKFNDKILNV